MIEVKYTLPDISCRLFIFPPLMVSAAAGLKTDYKLRLWSESLGLRLTCAKLEDVTVTEDERRGRVGRGEARPGLGVSVARPTLYLQTTWFQIYLHLQYVYNVWG